MEKLYERMTGTALKRGMITTTEADMEMTKAIEAAYVAACQADWEHPAIDKVAAYRKKCRLILWATA